MVDTSYVCLFAMFFKLKLGTGLEKDLLMHSNTMTMVK